MNRNILILGATSSIAQEVAKIYAASHDNLFLVGRDRDRLEIIMQDLFVRGAGKINFYAMYFNAIEDHEKLLKSIDQGLAPVDIVLIAYGTLPKQKICE